MGQNSSRPSRIDRIDLSILAALFAQARISKVQMSEAVGLSASRCYERMRRLEQTEIIRGYHADIDIARLVSCLQFQVQIKLLNYTGARARHFEKTILRIPEVISCHGVLGHVDYVIVVVAATIERYQEVIAELRSLSENDFDFVTFPISKAIKSHSHSDLKQIVSRLIRDDPGSG